MKVTLGEAPEESGCERLYDRLSTPDRATAIDSGRAPVEGTLGSTGARRALAGFFVSGVLLSFLGAILPSWQHHLSSEYSTIALVFPGADRGTAGVGVGCAAAAGAQGHGLDAGLRVRRSRRRLCSIWPLFRRRFRRGGGWRDWR